MARTCELVLLVLHGLDGHLHLVLALGTRPRQVEFLLLDLCSAAQRTPRRPVRLPLQLTRVEAPEVSGARRSRI